MITLNVFFENYEPNHSNGTAILYENLITENVTLVLNNNLVLNEIQHFISKTVEILKLRYEKVNVDIKWETAKKEAKDNE